MMSSLTQQRLKHALFYNERTGEFSRKDGAGSAGWIWKSPRHRHAYIKIQIDGVGYFAHRLAWLYVHGQWPNGHIDHIDGDGTNNSISNLRDVSRRENMRNIVRVRKGNKSGYKGVNLHLSSGKWRARIATDEGRKSLGLFNTPEEAHAAYVAAEKVYHGKFARQA